MWISFFRNPQQRDDFDARSRRSLVFMSSVVALELMAGCRTSRQEKMLISFLKPFEKAARVITPDHGSLLEAGRVLARLAGDGIGTSHRQQIVNDVLIAVTAGRAGAVVVTANASDFSLIARHARFQWMLPERPAVAPR